MFLNGALRNLLVSIVVGFTALFLAPAPAALRAQSSEPFPNMPAAYWQYDAPGPLGSVLVADVDHNGVDEFVAVTDSYQVVLLDSLGRVSWTFQTPGQTPILQLTTVNIHGAADPRLELLLVTQDELFLLSSDGSLLWRKPLDLPPIPTVLLTGTVGETQHSSAGNQPLMLAGFDHDGDGADELLVVLRSGLVQLYDASGDLLWKYPESPPPSDEPLPLIAIGDLDRDGRQEIVFSYFIRYTRLVLLDGDGKRQWERALSGRTTTLELIAWDDHSPLEIAAGNSFGEDQRRVVLYDANGITRWYHTPNKTITDLQFARLRQGSVLLVGTEVGTVVAYDRQGRREWRYQPSSPNRAIVSISPREGAVAQEGQPALAFTLASLNTESPEAGVVVLLDESGRELQRFQSASASGQTRLVDVNGDGINELMLASFGTLSLTDPGTGARKNSQAWDYRLFAAPLSKLVTDLNGDGEDELLVGTRDGQLHILESSNGQAEAIVNTGGELSHLALIPAPGDDDQTFVVAVHNHPADAAQNSAAQAFVELIQPSGRTVWSRPVTYPGLITSLVTGNTNRDRASEIVVGTNNGLLAVLSTGGRELWQATLPGAVQSIALVDSNEDGVLEIFAVAGGNQLLHFDGTNDARVVVNFNLHRIQQMVPLSHPMDGETAFVVATDDGLLRAITASGTQPWQWRLPSGPVTHLADAGDSLLVATGDGSLLNLDLQENVLLWQLQNFDQVSTIYWGDLDGGGGNDLATGTRDGQILLHTGDARQWDLVSLSSSSSVFALTGLRRGLNQQRQLAAITDNGVIQLYEAKPNRPPLIVDPRVEVGSSRYDVRVTVLEEDGDEVAVALQTYDAARDQWQTVEQRTVLGRDTLLFPISHVGVGTLDYRFVFDDGTHQGIVTPPVGPPAPPARSLGTMFLPAALVLTGGLGLTLVIRQSLSVDARARRFYRRLRQQPAHTLRLLDRRYHEVNGAPDFLLSLVNRARPDRNLPLVNLLDGLFLLEGRPGAAVAILDNALEEADQLSPAWRDLPCWQLALNMTHHMLEAPSVMELSLLRPQLSQMLAQFEAHPLAAALAPFLDVLANLRDSERVDLADDRIVYLLEALGLLRQIKESMADRPVSIGARITQLLEERISGLVAADIELLRGQAQLFATLKTKRIVVDNGHALVALEIENNGRAAARNITVTMDRDAAYKVDSLPETVSLLSPGRAVVTEFLLNPSVEDRFRAAFTITYDDRSQEHRRLQFADMVNLLPPQRDFSPMPNPYLPGTPLRSDSPLFYGREELFEFIVENAGQITSRNVLILIGQRRTGKTSALLRLDQHLPPHIIPVYIDCQSLGVLPGMPALFHDLAWHLADAVEARGHKVDVPPMAQWRDDPTRLFRHQFLPAIKEKLPPDAILLLVFDEFEAFENLVSDGILPPTLFTYMRHLMQHSEGLGFAFVGTRRLEEMTSDYWSVLFNIALYRHIGFLGAEAAVKLITEPVSPHIVYDDLALDKIWRVTAGHPYFLQLVCYTLVKRANQQKTGYITISDVNAALEEMLRLGEVHFAYLWQRSSYTERALLTAVAHLMEREVPFHPADLIQYLEQYGFRFDPAEVTGGLNRLVEREIMRELTDEGTTLYELKIGLVGLWAAQNKSLSKLYESKNQANGLETARANVERA